MPVLHCWKLPVLYPSLNCGTNNVSWPWATMEYTYCQPNTYQVSYYELAMKNTSPTYVYLNSLRFHAVRATHVSVNTGNMSSFGNFHESKVNIGSSDMETCNNEAQVGVFNESLVTHCDKDQKEMERRRKIGLANKGRVPWNKGRKHNAETRLLIKQRTIEALRNPKVRKKMAEHPLPHSDDIKAKISSALKHVWAKRFRRRRLEEKFLLSWLENIAKAAKNGGSDQHKLDWDSYDKIKHEMVVQQLQWAADRAKAKEMAKIMAKQAALARAERAALKKVEKLARVAQKTKEREEKAKARREMKRKADRKSEKNVGELSRGLKLKRLIKIHKKKSVTVPVSIRPNMVDSHIRAWENFDVNLIDKEKMQREVSLADQIRAAKNKRGETMAKEVLATSSRGHSVSVRSED